MIAVVAKWGNSLALRLPKRLAEDAGIQEGTRVEVRVEGGTLIATPAKPKYTLDELLAGLSREERPSGIFYDRSPQPPRMLQEQPDKETDWGPPAGDEVW